MEHRLLSVLQMFKYSTNTTFGQHVLSLEIFSEDTSPPLNEPKNQRHVLCDWNCYEEASQYEAELLQADFAFTRKTLRVASSSHLLHTSTESCIQRSGGPTSCIGILRECSDHV